MFYVTRDVISFRKAHLTFYSLLLNDEEKLSAFLNCKGEK